MAKRETNEQSPENRADDNILEETQHPSTTVHLQGRMPEPHESAALSLKAFLDLPDGLLARVSSHPTISVLQNVQNHN